MKIFETIANMFKKRVLVTVPIENQIKGNVNKKGEKIYHTPEGRYYNQVKAAKFFSSIEEAENEGFRPSKR